MKVALGTAQFGLPYGIANQSGQVSRPQAKCMLQFAQANGIDTIDTAMAYGDSESCLGEVGAQGFKLITKLPPVPENVEDLGTWVQQQMSASLARMGVTSVYGLLLHRSEQLLSPTGAELFQALQTLRENGQVQKVGVSIYSPCELSTLTSRYHFDLVQAPFNLVDQRLHTSGWMQRLNDDGVEIHTRSVFLQGLLLMSRGEIPAKFTKWNGLWQRWHSWLADHNGCAVQACLAFNLSFPNIDRVIVGADSLSQLAQIVSVANSKSISVLPDLQCNDEGLINPAHWPKL